MWKNWTASLCVWDLCVYTTGNRSFLAVNSVCFNLRKKKTKPGCLISFLQSVWHLTETEVPPILFWIRHLPHTQPGGNTHWLEANGIRSDAVLGQRRNAYTSGLIHRWQGVFHSAITASELVWTQFQQFWMASVTITLHWRLRRLDKLPGRISQHFLNVLYSEPVCCTLLARMFFCLLCIIFIDPICTCSCKLF